MDNYIKEEKHFNLHTCFNIWFETTYYVHIV